MVICVKYATCDFDAYLIQDTKMQQTMMQMMVKVSLSWIYLANLKHVKDIFHPSTTYVCYDFSTIEPRVTYVPPALPDDEDSIFSHYESGINFDKYDEILVDVSGTNPPQAIMVGHAEVFSPLTQNW